MQIPSIGLGTWKSTNDGELRNAIRYAIVDAGYRHIDCSTGYGNEKVVGAALKEIFDEGLVKREEMWITTKLWNTDHRPEYVEPAIKKSLEDLQLEYVDLFLMHWPTAFVHTGDMFPTDEHGKVMFDRFPFIETWKAMEPLIEKGYTKRIGVSNFTIGMLERLRYADVKYQPYTNQIEHHLYMQNGPMRNYLNERGIILTGYSTLGTPDFAKQGEPVVLKDEVLLQIAEETNQPVGSVAIKFLLQICPSSSLLVKSVTPSRIKSNINLNFELSMDQVERLKKRERCYRYINIKTLWGTDELGDGW